jgi:hypothetical protein
MDCHQKYSKNINTKKNKNNAINPIKSDFMLNSLDNKEKSIKLKSF